MNDPEATERAVRRAAARAIIARPKDFMVCEGCESIFRRGGKVERTGICSQCHAFRFDLCITRVIHAARALGNRLQSSVTPDDLK